MSFDLNVKYRRLPSNLKSAWEDALADIGLLVEFHPNIELSECRGGHVAVRLQVKPNDDDEFSERYGTEPVLAGFELSIGDRNARLSTSSGRSTADFRVQCVAAATLARISSGVYQDPQAGITRPGDTALDAACEQVSAFETSAKDSEWKLVPFNGWDDL